MSTYLFLLVVWLIALPLELLEEPKHALEICYFHSECSRGVNHY
jgi:hypothetical protein